MSWVACGAQDDGPPPRPRVESAGPKPAQDPIQGEPTAALILSQAWFVKVDGKPKPGPARLEIWRNTGEGWKATRLEDGDANVFHKSMPYNGGILTASGSKAALKHWKWTGTEWTQELLWERSWGGRFDRMRDFEVGDVDGDGVDEIVIATHDSGVVAVYDPNATGEKIVEMDQKPDTFVHEIEIGDVDGDGKLEFYATPTDRNKVGKSQDGWLVRYDWDGSQYVRSMVDVMGATHAKEALVTDIDGDGIDELFSVLEAELGPDKQIVKPVEIRQYTWTDGTWSHTTAATLDDRQTRFLVPGDFDGDGVQELVAASMKTGLWLLDLQADGSWTKTNFETNSSGFEHTTYAADLDGDGTLELYVAADNQKQLNRYTWDAEKKTFVKETLGTLGSDVITWNISTMTL
jgi:hypothetical protein